MYVHQTEEYFRTLTDLKNEYAKDIQIHIGVEAVGVQSIAFSPCLTHKSSTRR
jgi:hypothetical protein